MTEPKAVKAWLFLDPKGVPIKTLFRQEDVYLHENHTGHLGYRVIPVTITPGHEAKDD